MCSMKRTLSGWLTTLLVALDGCCLATTEEHHTVTSTPMSATTESLTNVSRDASPKKQLHLLGLFGKEGDYPVGWAFQFASEMAVNDINKRADMLPGYTLVLDSIDTKCDSFEAIDQLYRQFFQANSTIVMVLGGTTSHVTEITSKASRRYNLVQVTFSAVSPTLSNKEVFPWLFRLLTSESVHSYVRVLLLLQFGWRNIWVAQQSFHLFSSSVEVMKKEMEKRNITLEGIQPFDGDPTFVIENLQKNDARIIYFASYAEKARQACCVAYSRNFYGPHIVWIFPGFYDTNWFKSTNDTNCSTHDIVKVIDGYLSVVDVTFDKDDDDEEDVIGGWPLAEFSCRYCAHYRGVPYTPDFRGDDCLCYRDPSDPRMSGFNRAPFGYDTVWASALALNRTLVELRAHGSRVSQEDFSFKDVDVAKMIYRNMKNLSFRGLTGSVSFTSTGDRIPKLNVLQFQWDMETNSGAFVKIGDYRNCLEEIVWDEEEAKWTEGSSIVKVGQYNGCPDRMKWNVTAARWRGKGVPPSSRLTMYVLQPLPWTHYIVMCSLAGLGMLLSLAFLTFNIKHRNVRLIKMSSPRINNLILAGCLLVYSKVFMKDLYASKLDILCYFQQYSMVLGFSLGYGALFAKTWRVYEIMTASYQLKRKALHDCRLFLTVGLLVAVNVAVLVVRTLVDRVTMVTVDNDDWVDEADRKELLEVRQTLECHSFYQIHFTAVLLALQGLLILFGVFLAWQTRKTAIPELNDSRWIGLCIYNVVVLGSVGVILVLGTRQAPHVTYVVESAIVIAGTTLTQCFVFIPKLVAYKHWLHNKKGSQGILTRTIYVTGQSTAPSALAFTEHSPTTGSTTDTQSLSLVSTGHSTPARKSEEVDIAGCTCGENTGMYPGRGHPALTNEADQQCSQALLKTITPCTDMFPAPGSCTWSTSGFFMSGNSSSPKRMRTSRGRGSFPSVERPSRVSTICQCACSQADVQDAASGSKVYKSMDLLSVSTSSIAAAILSPRHAHWRLTQSYFGNVRSREDVRSKGSAKRSLSFDTLDFHVTHSLEHSRHALRTEVGCCSPDCQGSASAFRKSSADFLRSSLPPYFPSHTLLHTPCSGGVCAPSCPAVSGHRRRNCVETQVHNFANFPF
ncbi:gamma-aminobutyric acid type B receptor subunit 1-like [Pomacea canaliculata]|uniref:gamma-aminobutyric acid type B receptor subunit 1-like n=1 Tax=Pomacea canaliculata TaxID=400727 RepID=UPI000D73976D|nr:gamma-aminobutyric acid type B receptor subunit 1-like [Pomacea canaliculata]